MDQRVHPEIDELAPFSAMLRAERAELTERFREERQQTVEQTSGEAMDAVDRSRADDDIATAARYSDRHRDQLREIDAAFERIASGTYGFCARCEEPIDRARLEARPVARECAGCASLSERETQPNARPTL